MLPLFFLWVYFYDGGTFVGTLVGAFAFSLVGSLLITNIFNNFLTQNFKIFQLNSLYCRRWRFDLLHIRGDNHYMYHVNDICNDELELDRIITAFRNNYRFYVIPASQSNV